MATPTFGYMVPIDVARRHKAMNRDLGAGLTFEEAWSRNDPRYQTGYDTPDSGHIESLPAFTEVDTGRDMRMPGADFERVAQGGGSGGSSGMSLADLFDNSKWETHMVDAAPKRGGQVERRRYIGGGGGQNVPVYDPSQSSTEAPEFISTGEAWIRNPDLLGERFRNRDTSGPVTLPPVNSLDKQDMLDVAGRVGVAPEPPGPSFWERTGEKGMGYGADAWDAATGFAGDVNRKISEIDQTPAAAAAASTIGDVRESLDPGVLQDLLRGEVDKHDNWLADRYRNVDDAARKSREIAERLRHEFEAPEALTNTVGVNQLGTIGTAGLGIYDLIKYYMGLKEEY